MAKSWTYDKEISTYHMPIDSRHDATFCPKRNETSSMLLSISDHLHSRQIFSGAILLDGSARIEGDPHSYLRYQSKIAAPAGLDEPDAKRLNTLIDAIDTVILGE